MRSGRRFAALAAVIVAVSAPRAAEARRIDVAAGGDHCAAINSAAPGDEVVLAAGDYPRPCNVTASGTVDAPIVVRSADEAARARLTYAGNAANLIELRAVSNLVFRALHVPRTADAVDAFNVRASENITVERCLFEDIGGGVMFVRRMDAARTDSRNLVVRDNVMRNLRDTALYFGQEVSATMHDRALAIVVEGNLIAGVTPRAGRVGYGMQFKQDSYGTVRDNTIYDTAGPAIQVYGGPADSPPTVVEGNYVQGSRNDACVNVSGGPALVRNNVVVGCGYGGIRAQNYMGRDLQRGVVFAHNTLVDNARDGFDLEGWRAGADNVLAFNAIVPRAGTMAIQPAAAPGVAPGNVTCAVGCFVMGAASPYDFTPAAGSPLVDVAGAGAEPWRPADDFVGTLRGATADVGAIERVDGAPGVVLGAGRPRPPRGAGPGRSDGGIGSDAGGDSGGGADAAAMDASGVDATGVRDSAGSDAGGESAGPVIRTGGCGCAVAGARATGARAALLAWLLVALTARRTRPGSSAADRTLRPRLRPRAR